MASPEEQLTKDDPYHDTRVAVVEQINRDRAAAGLPPVELDALASGIGDRHCQEMAGHRYLSHWNQRGLLPYHRYHLAGGRDHVQENLSRLTIVSLDPSPIPTTPGEILPDLLRAHERLLNEPPPLDGHRRNILDPHHTHVGIGFAVIGGELTVAQEFVNRYARLRELPEMLPPGALPVEGEMLHKNFGPYYCVLVYEGLPRARTPEELNATYAYSDMEGETFATVSPWQMQFNRSQGRFRFSVRFRDPRPGFYHLLLWVRDRIGSIPYELLGSGLYKVDTKDAIPCAGWIFRQ